MPNADKPKVIDIDTDISKDIGTIAWIRTHRYRYRNRTIDIIGSR